MSRLIYFSHFKRDFVNKKIGTKLLHAYVYIVQAKYWINSSKAVVGIDRPMKGLSMHIQKSY